jgi:hypothetical protein
MNFVIYEVLTAASMKMTVMMPAHLLKNAISGSHGGEYEYADSLVGYCAV